MKEENDWVFHDPKNDPPMSEEDREFFDRRYEIEGTLEDWKTTKGEGYFSHKDKGMKPETKMVIIALALTVGIGLMFYMVYQLNN